MSEWVRGCVVSPLTRSLTWGRSKKGKACQLDIWVQVDCKLAVQK